MIRFYRMLASTGALLLLAATQTHAFGGGIAVGMSRMLDEGELDVSFRARATLKSEDFDVEETIYYRPGMLREEMTVEGEDMVTIQRHDLGKVWLLMPQGMYMETGLDEVNEQVKSFRLVEHERVGTEPVNGIDTTRYQTVWETDEGRFAGSSWVTDDGITVKAILTSESDEGRHRMDFEITELQRAEQPEARFELPEGYVELNLSNLIGGDRPREAPTAEPEPEGAEAGAEKESGLGDKVRQGIRGLFRRDRG